MRTGIVNAVDNRYSYSTTTQTVTIPSGAVDQILRFWMYPQSSEPTYMRLPVNPLAIEEKNAVDVGDAQMALILDSGGNILERLLIDRRNDQAWIPYSFDISHYAGRTIRVYFGTYNNGTGGITGMHVDDVTLGTCGEATPTGTPTATATTQPADTATPTETTVPTETATSTATGTPPSNNLEYSFFVPLAFYDHPLGINGRITGPDGAGIGGVTVKTDTGQVTVSNDAGVYGFSGLEWGTYVVLPENAGLVFQPQSRLVTLPPSAVQQDFVAISPTQTPGPYPGSE